MSSGFSRLIRVHAWVAAAGLLLTNGCCWHSTSCTLLYDRHACRDGCGHRSRHEPLNPWRFTSCSDLWKDYCDEAAARGYRQSADCSVCNDGGLGGLDHHYSPAFELPLAIPSDEATPANRPLTVPVKQAPGTQAPTPIPEASVHATPVPVGPAIPGPVETQEAAVPAIEAPEVESPQLEDPTRPSPSIVRPPVVIEAPTPANTIPSARPELPEVSSEESADTDDESSETAAAPTETSPEVSEPVIAAPSVTPSVTIPKIDVPSPVSPTTELPPSIELPVNELPGESSIRVVPPSPEVDSPQVEIPQTEKAPAIQPAGNVSSRQSWRSSRRRLQ